MKSLFSVILLFFIVGCKSRSNEGPQLPSFNILLPDSSTRINTGEIEEGSPIVLLYFSPDCEHCQKETEAILSHMSSLKAAKFYFVTNDPFDRLKQFNEYYKLKKYANITLGRDDQFYLLRHLKGVFPPYLILYDRHKQQRAIYQGDTPIDTIISRVNQL